MSGMKNFLTGSLGIRSETFSKQVKYDCIIVYTPTRHFALEMNNAIAQR